jgi:nicotinamide riboside kinase
MSFKIAFTGPESTGKTSLSMLVAETFGGVYVPEFARSFLEQTKGYYEEQDLETIALGQFNSLINQKVAENQILISDTDMTVMKIWSQFKYGRVSQVIEQLYQEETFDHLFLCDTDIQWEEDPLREHPESREELFALYLELIQAKTKKFTIVKGSLEERLSQVQYVLKEKMFIKH